MSDKLLEMVRGWDGLHPFLPYKESQLRQMVRDGRLAPPIKIGPRAIAWLKTDIIEAQQRILREQAGRK